MAVRRVREKSGHAGGDGRAAPLSGTWWRGRLNEALAGSRVFDGPTLLVRGGQSDYVRAEDEEPLRRMFPRMAVETIASAGHWVHADAPEEFLRIVSSFLRALPP